MHEAKEEKKINFVTNIFMGLVCLELNTCKTSKEKKKLGRFANVENRAMVAIKSWGRLRIDIRILWLL